MPGGVLDQRVLKNRDFGEPRVSLLVLKGMVVGPGELTKDRFVMLYHGRHLNLFTFRVTELRRRYLGSDFTTPAWLPIYEIGRRGWDTSRTFDKIARIIHETA